MNKGAPGYFEEYPIEDYLDLDAGIEDFPDEIYIAFAVCGMDCGHSEFIVDGQTQECEICHRQMFRTEVRKYILAKR
jgi:hypothetical protein